MKFNLREVIPEVVEQYSHGKLTWKEVKVDCDRTNGTVRIEQAGDFIFMNEDQAIQLYKMLNQVFGDLN